VPQAVEPPPESRDHDVSDVMAYTPKHHAVMQMICMGMGTDDMAEVLAVTPSTVKVHIRGIMRKARLRTRAQIVMHYRDLLDGVSDADYKAFAGIPRDWAERRSDYPKVNEMLRTKSR
jgi:DNA-binding CsgD family transcriptional regulator